MSIHVVVRCQQIENIKHVVIETSVDYDFHQSHVKTPVTGNYYDYNALIWTIYRPMVGVTLVRTVGKTVTYF